MPTSTYIALANYTVTGSPASSVTFSSIPATYRDLVLVINGGTSDAGVISLEIQPNSESTNGSLVAMYGSSGGAISETNTRIFCTLGPTNSMAIIHAMDYSATDKHKTFLIRSGDATEAWAIAGRWASTTAINALKIVDTGSATLDVGTTLNLFGIIS